MFPVDQLKVFDESNTCDTALSLQGCKTGEPVRVYYDPYDLSVTNLEEFSAAARGRLFFGTWMVSCGLILIGLYFILNRVGKNSGKPDDLDGNDGKGETDVLHVAPDE